MLKTLSNLKSWQKSLIIIFYDFLIAAFGFYLSLSLRYGSFDFPGLNLANIAVITFAVALIQSTIFYKLGLYKGIWRFSSTPDLVRIIKSVSLSCLVVTFALFLFTRLEHIPRSVFIIDWLLLIVGLGGGRFAYRLVTDNTKYKTKTKEVEPVLIIGAGYSGDQLFRDIRNNSKVKCRVVGFVDDNPNLEGKSLQNLPILGTTSELAKIIEKTKVRKVFIAIPEATSEEIRKIIDKANGQNVSFKTLPKLSDIIDGKNQLSQLRNISIEDLLGRESIKLDMKLIHNMLTNKIVMVTGAGGSIGSELCNQVAKFAPKTLVLLEQSEFNLYQLEADLKQKFPKLEIISIIGDVRNKCRVENVLKRFNPQILLHAAAYKHVPIMENNPFEAIQTNVHGTKTVAELAEKYGVEKFVLVSTDKAVNPTNIMGATKRIAEIVTNVVSQKTSTTQFITVRFGNVLGSSGSVIPLFKKQIERGGPVTITHKDVKRYFMSIPEASQLVLEAASLGNGGEIFVLDMGQPVKIIDLAYQMIRLSGLKPYDDIDVKVTGLRPGEKLYEELLSDEETTIKTSHPKVHIARSRDDNSDLMLLIEKLMSLTSENSLDEYKSWVKKIVPEYVSPDEHLKAYISEEETENSVH